MYKIAVDTSFLIFMIKRKIEINRVNELFNGPIKFYTSKGVLNELENIANSEKIHSKYAKLSLNLMNKMNFEIENDEKIPDEWLIEQEIIATVDMPLSKQAVKKGVRVINITKSNKLVLR